VCFSPEMDLVAFVVVGAVGIDAVRHVRHRRELMLAALPLLFALHQLVEAFVWWGLDGSVAWSVGRAALWLYVGFAFVLPVYVPLAVRAVEPIRERREIMTVLVGIGFAVTVLLLVEAVRGPLAAHAAGLHLSYDIGHGAGNELEVLYIGATCGALLASSYRLLAIFGALNLVAVTVLAVLTRHGVPSLWCFWAAVTSVVIAVHLRRAEPVALTAAPPLGAV
jgi:hypothetical protein